MNRYPFMSSTELKREIQYAECRLKDMKETLDERNNPEISYYEIKHNNILLRFYSLPNLAKFVHDNGLNESLIYQSKIYE